MNPTRTELIEAVTPVEGGRHKVLIHGFEVVLSFLVEPKIGDKVDFFLTPLFDGVMHKSVVVHLTLKPQVGTPVYAKADLHFSTGTVQEGVEGRITGHECDLWEDSNGDQHRGILRLLVDVNGVTHETPALDSDTYWSLKPIPTTAIDLILEDWDEPQV